VGEWTWLDTKRKIQTHYINFRGKEEGWRTGIILTNPVPKDKGKGTGATMYQELRGERRKGKCVSFT